MDEVYERHLAPLFAANPTAFPSQVYNNVSYEKALYLVRSRPYKTYQTLTLTLTLTRTLTLSLTLTLTLLRRQYEIYEPGQNGQTTSESEGGKRLNVSEAYLP